VCVCVRERVCVSVCVCVCVWHRASSESRRCAFGCQARLVWRNALMVGVRPFYDVYSDRKR